MGNDGTKGVIRMGDTLKPGLFRGVATDLSKRLRFLFTMLLCLLAVSLCFSQFGIMSYGESVEGDLNFMLLILPAAMGALMLGLVPGVTIGVLTGVFLMFRAQWSPTSYFDIYLSDPVLSVVSISVGSLLAAAVFVLSGRLWPSRSQPDLSPLSRVRACKVASIIIGCFLLCAAFSYGSRGVAYAVLPSFWLNNNVLAEFYLSALYEVNVFIEVLVNTALLSVACIASEAFDANRRAGSWPDSLSFVFSCWLLLFMVMVFMLASTMSFCAETVRADTRTRESLEAELDYMQQQIAYRVAIDAPVEGLADGYDAENGGTVVIVRDHMIVTSNNAEYSGKPVSGTISNSDEEFDLMVMFGDQFVAYEETDRTYIVVQLRDYGEYTIVAYVPLLEIYAARTSTLLYSALFFLVLLAVVFMVVRRLLRNVVVAPIHRTNDSLELITEGDLNERVTERNVSEFASLSSGINSTVRALRDSVSDVEARIAQELLTAQAIQESALPREFPPFPEIDKFDIYASMKTAKEVGGDFYDFFLIGDKKLGFLIADVSGKGIPASLFMMTAKTQIDNYMEDDLSLGEAIDAANHQLCLSNDANMFVTAFLCVLDYESGELSYVNAGHNPPLILHDGEWEWIRDVSGMPLGLFDGIPYEQFTRKLEVGDMLYLYTDGVTEAMDSEGSLFGEERLEKTLRKYEKMNPRSVGVGVRRAITDFTLDAEQSDDITMLALKYGVPPEPKAVMVLKADDSQLVHVWNFIHEELHRRRAPKSVRNPLDIAAEELFVNVCHYAYPDATDDDPGEVRISFQYEDNPPTLAVEIADDGVPYNPLAKPDAVTPDDIMDVPIGGLGILMAKNSVDEMLYERVGDSNVLTFKKSW